MIAKSTGKIYVFVTLVFVSGCAVTDGELFARDRSQADQSAIHFYRTPGFAGGGLAPLLKINGKEVAGIQKGGYLSVILPPSTHQIELVDNKNDMAAWSKDEDIRADITLTKGEQIIYEFVVQNWSGVIIPIGYVFIPSGSRSSALVKRTFEEAASDLQSLKGSVIDMQLGSSRAKPQNN
jgi:Protein of unknown function (DUF2846).